MPKNDFLPFATRSTANVVEQDAYADSAFVKEGFVSGLAKSAEINKAIRQGTSIASAVAQFVADYSGDDVLDDGDIAKIKNSLDKTIRAISDVPKGGKTGQALIKQSDEDKDVTWNDISGIPSGGETGQALIKKSNSDDDVGWGYIAAFPVGAGIYHYGTTAPPKYLVCNGAAVSRSAYPELFAVIGTIYGAGDGSTTFNLPNDVGRFSQGSATPGQYIDAGLPNITGGLGYMGGGGVRDSYGAFYAVGNGVTYVHNSTTITATYAEFAASRSSGIYGASNTVQPPALTKLPCIKYE